ncbi:AAA family ATPase [Micromonospora sp. L5]|uniref:AAA family ATPase n=1 Tax=Micromonospora TaxID=1873 RepID=UPI00143BC6E4|nr:AAA family ATPase [Micromonospora sp. L5]
MMDSESASQDIARPAEFLVAEMSVRGLFGRYSYRVSTAGAASSQSAPPLMLLYGRNGSGKTTVLRLLLHLLSPADNQGHRTALARTPFKQFVVRLGDGTQIAVDKERSVLGPYAITVKSKNRTLVRQAYMLPEGHHSVVAVDEKRVPLKEAPDAIVLNIAKALQSIDQSDDNPFMVREGQDSYIEYLGHLGVKPILLGDDRRVYADEPERPRRNRYEPDRRQEEGVPIVAELASSLSQTTEWLRQQLLSGAALGARGADEVYRDVLTQLGRISEPEEMPDIHHLRQRLVSLDARSRRFSEFGLATPFESTSMLEMLANIPDSRLPLVASILDPYLTGQDARLDSLQETERLVRTFVDYLNDYFDDKRVTFTPRTGIRIYSDGDYQIPASRLSSGERQLLLLLCRAVLSRQATTLFMIDEPELSLNAKWQRRLVQTLLDLVEGSNVQFIMATHSIEIITKHRPYLAELRDAE